LLVLCFLSPLRREGQSKRYPQTSQRRCVEVEFSAIEFGKLAGDRQPKSEAGRTFIDSFARPQNLWNLVRPQAWPVVLDHNAGRVGHRGRLRDVDASAIGTSPKRMVRNSGL
jgi:hypothetical protein